MNKHIFFLTGFFFSSLAWGQVAIEPEESSLLLIDSESPKIDCASLKESISARFSVTDRGRVIDVDITSIASNVNAKSTEKAMSSWLFKPASKGHLAVVTHGLIATFKCVGNNVTFKITR